LTIAPPTAAIAANPDIRASGWGYRFLPLVHPAFGKGEKTWSGTKRPIPLGSLNVPFSQNPKFAGVALRVTESGRSRARRQVLLHYADTNFDV
jgi:hypothetical protein